VINNRFDSTLENLLSQEIAALSSNFEFIGLELDHHVSPKVLRVYADVSNKRLVGEISNKDIRGITLEDCAKIAYHLNTFLKVIPDFHLSNYLLEVSSPGIERRLFNLLQFEQHLGKEIKLHLVKPLNGRSNFIGVLCSVDRSLNKVFVQVDRQDLCFDFDNIAKANLVYRKL
jgi:ribosome maturation factor RimP